jgi:hypothetical protein
LSVQQVSGCIRPGRGVGVLATVLSLLCNFLRYVLVKYSMRRLDCSLLPTHYTSVVLILAFLLLLFLYTLFNSGANFTGLFYWDGLCNLFDGTSA